MFFYWILNHFSLNFDILTNLGDQKENEFSIHFTEKESPEFLIDSSLTVEGSSQSISRDGEIEIKCLVSGSPKPQIEWYKVRFS